MNKRGHNNVSAASSGTTALAEIERENYDIVICDYHMPGITGLDVFKILKDAGSTCRFLLWTNADLHELPKFDGFGFLGAVGKTELDKIFGTLESLEQQLAISL